MSILRLWHSGSLKSTVPLLFYSWTVIIQPTRLSWVEAELSLPSGFGNKIKRSEFELDQNIYRNPNGYPDRDLGIYSNKNPNRCIKKPYQYNYMGLVDTGTMHLFLFCYGLLEMMFTKKCVRIFKTIQVLHML